MGNPLILVAIAIAGASLALAAYRFFAGPDAPDRVVAFDVMTIVSISLIVGIAALARRVVFLDVAIVYGLLSFLGVMVVAKYLEWGL